MTLRMHTSKKDGKKQQAKVKLMGANMANRECSSLYKPASPQMLKNMLVSLREAKDSYHEMPTDPARRQELLMKGNAVKDFIIKLSQVVNRKNLKN